MMESTMPQNNEQDNQPSMGGSPIDDIISTVDGFISNPKNITPESLTQLKSDLEDLKSVLDQEESPSGEDQQSTPSSGGLAAMIGGGK